MKPKRRKVPAEFGPETRFELKPVAPLFRAAVADRFEGLRDRLLSERLGETVEPALASGVRRAANEAEALAWVTAYPLLVFPALFAEKADAALFQAERQEQVFQRSRELLAV